MGGILEFLWTAFRDYWKVWVTGTGTVGFFLFLLGAFERRRGRTLTWKIYTSILFCAFWFLGTFSAWHDSQKNLRLVIHQREQDNSSFGECRANLQTQTALKESWQERYADQQRIINALQGPQLQQQATLNNCVVSLGKMNPIVMTDTSVTVFSVAHSTKTTFLSTDTTYFSAIVISTNHHIEAAGTLKCSKPFDLQSAPTLPFRHSGISGTGTLRKISDTEYYLKNEDTAAEWNATTPMYLVITSKEEQIGPCTFTLDQ